MAVLLISTFLSFISCKIEIISKISTFRVSCWLLSTDCIFHIIYISNRFWVERKSKFTATVDSVTICLCKGVNEDWKMERWRSNDIGTSYLGGDPYEKSKFSTLERRWSRAPSWMKGPKKKFLVKRSVTVLRRKTFEYKFVRNDFLQDFVHVFL